MAVMVSLDVLGINITPLIAGLGIGGVAVALAIQPTLSNLFAGTYVITEGVVNPGDYIEMDGGVSGYVVDVNWRSTRLRTWTNNLVIIPNSRFADSVITNYSKPDEHVNVYLTCGVAYESDLGRVEQVGHEVMERVLAEHPGAVLDYGAYFGYETFGESNIDFWLFVQAKDRLASFEVRSELIKQLHSRLAEEGITINYPVRTLHFPDGWNPQDGAPLLPGAAAVRTPAILRTRADLAADMPGGGDGPDV
jgi:small-conductance mechanosensitive channel